MFNARKTHKAYIDIGIFSLYFIVVSVKIFVLLQIIKGAPTDLKICQYSSSHENDISKISH